MNIKEYRDKKALGLAEVVKAGGGYALAVKRFSSDDGSELMPEITAIDPDELDLRKAELVEAIADYDLLIADIDVLTLK
jgi:hypothetical protein